VTFSDIIEHPAYWLRHEGPDGAIVLSSRVRLARNLRDRPFPGWSKKAERIALLKATYDTVVSLPQMHDGFATWLENLSALDKQMLVECHLISREHAAKGAGSAIVVNPDQTLAIMLNEEDHFRMQAIRPGLQLDEAFESVSEADNQLARKLDFAYHPTWGYLTACPTNVGTGMRASAMLHLPALMMNDQMGQVVKSIGKIGLAVRGLHGEGSDTNGNLFQVSNQTTLGETEEEIIDRLKNVIQHIIRHERGAREHLCQNMPAMLMDQIGRAYGILSHAHILTSKDALNLLSVIKLAIDLEIFPTTYRLTVDELFIATQPAHLQYRQAQKMDAGERDILRASLIRSKFADLPRPDATKILP